MLIINVPGMQDTDRRLFAKPIKFFHEMRELFSKSTANGSLAKDPFTCMQDEGDSDDNDIDCYAPPEDVLPEDSDTLPIGGETNSSTKSLSDSGAKRLTENSSGAKGKRSAEKTDNGRSSKKGVKQSRIGKSADEICHTLQALQASLMAPPPPPPPPSYDPHAALWERLEAMTITTDQKLTVGTFLARKENKGLRGFLCSSSDTTVQTWVFKFLSDNM